MSILHQDVAIIPEIRKEVEGVVLRAITELSLEVGPQRIIEGGVEVFRNSILDLLDEAACDVLERDRWVSNKVKQSALKSLGVMWKEQAPREIS
jgi:hypothetical protein